MVAPPLRRSPSEEDEDLEAVTLMAVLERHPSLLAVEELCREVAENPSDPLAQNAARNAIGELVRAGLLRRTGDLVLPTRAAVRIKELFGLIA